MDTLSDEVRLQLRDLVFILYSNSFTILADGEVNDLSFHSEARLMIIFIY